MIRVFAGFDEREAAGYHVFCNSVFKHSSRPVSFTPLYLPNLHEYAETHGDGTNAFVYSRFLVPFLSDYSGFAIFADGADMLCRADIAELWDMRDTSKAVQVVKHDYRSQYTRKYVGTSMEAANADYPRKNWSSLMLINCAHHNWRKITPTTVQGLSGAFLHRFEFLDDAQIGELPPAWNHLVREQDHDPNAKLVHFTLGVPAFKNYRHDPFAHEWFGSLIGVNEHV